MKTIIGVKPNFLSHTMCDKIISYAAPKLSEMETLGVGKHDGRVADGTWLDFSYPEVSIISNLIVDLSGYPSENQEQLHVVKYNTGGKYDAHYDFFVPNENYFDSVMSQGGQRVQSWLIYLNDDFEGGETHFPKEGATVVPHKGMVLGWNNIKGEGQLNWNSFHAGMPVLSGTKWIGVIWVREYKFGTKPEKQIVWS
jgi:prolyl 4-hydroxylase